jgi:hypothetical protein
MAVEVLVEPAPVLRAIRAVADVIEVDENSGFCASVYLEPGRVPVASLARSLRGASNEGDVLRWTMNHATGLHGAGLVRLPPVNG